MISGDTDLLLRELEDKVRHLNLRQPAERQRSSIVSLPMVLFGAGPLALRTIERMRCYGEVPVAIVDSDKSRWGQMLGNIQILPPPLAVSRFGKTARFVVTVYNGQAVRAQLKVMGCNHVSHFADLYFEAEEHFLPFCGLSKRDVILDAWQDVRDAAHVWHDFPSTVEYVSQLAWRLRLPDANLRQCEAASNCYFPEDLFMFSDAEMFFDCGAFDGDSVRTYLARQRSSTKPQVMAFEPDAGSFQKLSEYAASVNAAGLADIRVEPWAVSERSGELAFDALGSVGSVVKAHGKTKATAIALDDLDVVPSFIKMDVEGFELPALRGASKTLRRHKPILAISLYHHASDLWLIPSFIKSLVPEYRLFLRRYAQDCWELILYAVPESRLRHAT